VFRRRDEQPLQCPDDEFLRALIPDPDDEDATAAAAAAPVGCEDDVAIAA
jgi:hypothetical protein